MVANAMRQGDIEFTPRWTMAAICNNTPGLPFKDERAGLERRIKICPMSWQPDGVEDKSLRERCISGDLQPHVLRWMVEGAVKVLAHRSAGHKDSAVPHHDTVSARTAEYFDNSDSFADWKRLHIVPESGGFMPTEKAWGHFEKWRKDYMGTPKDADNMLIMSQRGFAGMLSAYMKPREKQKRMIQGERHWGYLGVTLADHRKVAKGNVLNFKRGARATWPDGEVAG